MTQKLAPDKAMLRRALRRTFDAYCRYGRRDNPDTLTNTNYMKLMRDARITPRAASAQILELVFSRQCRGAERTMSFVQFEDALIEIAARGRLLVEDVFRAICTLEGPQHTVQAPAVEEEEAAVARDDHLALLKSLAAVLAQLSHVARRAVDDHDAAAIAGDLRAAGAELTTLAATIEEGSE